MICHKQINGSNVTVGAREQIEDLNPDQLVNIQRVLDKHTEGAPPSTGSGYIGCPTTSGSSTKRTSGS